MLYNVNGSRPILLPIVRSVSWLVAVQYAQPRGVGMGSPRRPLPVSTSNRSSAVKSVMCAQRSALFLLRFDFSGDAADGFFFTDFCRLAFIDAVANGLAFSFFCGARAFISRTPSRVACFSAVAGVGRDKSIDIIVATASSSLDVLFALFVAVASFARFPVNNCFNSSCLLAHSRSNFSSFFSSARCDRMTLSSMSSSALRTTVSTSPMVFIAPLSTILKLDSTARIGLERTADFRAR